MSCVSYPITLQGSLIINISCKESIDTFEHWEFIFFCFLPSFIKLCRGPFSYDLFSLSNRCYDNYKIILFLFSWKPLLEKQTDSTNHVAYPWQYRVKYFTQERLPQRCILCPITFHAHRSSVSGQ